MTRRYFGDVQVGETEEFGAYRMTEREIVQFARQYDPQPFHVDADAARDSFFGGLVASGWHTVAVCNKLFIEEYWRDAAGQGGRNISELEWRAPVRPGDTLSVRIRVLDKSPTDDDSGPGHVTIRTTGVNQDGDDVVSWIGTGLIEHREQ